MEAMAGRLGKIGAGSRPDGPARPGERLEDSSRRERARLKGARFKRARLEGADNGLAEEWEVMA